MSKRPIYLVTVALMARELGTTRSRVTHVLERRHIEPSCYANRTKVFDNEALARVRYELTLIDARRDQCGCEGLGCLACQEQGDKGEPSANVL